MDVIINSFEAVAETSALPSQAAPPRGGGDDEAKRPIEPQDLAAMLRLLAERALRSYAH